MDEKVCKESFNKVRKMHFGAGILFNNSLRDTILMRLAGIRKLYGADKLVAMQNEIK